MSFVSKSRTKFAPKIKRRTPAGGAGPNSQPTKASSVVSSTSSISPEPSSASEASLTPGPINNKPTTAAGSKTTAESQPTPATKRKSRNHVIKAPDSTEVLKLMSSSSRRSSVSTGGPMKPGSSTINESSGRNRRLSSISRFDKTAGFVKPQPPAEKRKKKRSLKGSLAKNLQDPAKKRKRSMASTTEVSASGTRPLSSILQDFKEDSVEPTQADDTPSPGLFGEEDEEEEEEEDDDDDDDDDDNDGSGLTEFERHERRQYVKFMSFVKSNPWRRLPSKNNEIAKLMKKAGTNVPFSGGVGGVGAAGSINGVGKTINDNDNNNNKNKNNNNNNNNEEEEEDEDDDDGQDVKLVIDPISKRIKALPLLDYEKFKKYFDKEFKITDVKQIPKGTAGLGQEFFADFVLDEDNFTIADLCNFDLPIGEVSTDFKLARDASVKRKAAARKRRALRQHARMAGIPLEELLRNDETPEQRENRRREEVDKLFEAKPEPRQAIQLNFADGKISIDESSQFLDSRKNLNNDGKVREVENENPFENPIHCKSFTKNVYADRWTFDETIKFYRALSTWGTDFGIITNLFPHRNRRQIKMKFTLEEKKNLFLVELALKKKLPADFDEYVDSINEKRIDSEKKKFKSLEDFNRELEKEKDRHEQGMKMLLEEKEKARKEDVEERGRKEEVRKNEKKLSSKQQRLQMLRAQEEVIGEIS
ncbi:transcription factor TFIIIB subunit [Saccharomycopsis crataegensis]|uniref:Transcription factor TFIIIB subunit n=1 Tax=Saccharomycopsis crataegensis TaxID=43959 RepID=A0AAV5QUC0_9ASCO|nr:transcription factor TFIIIB subunit [Saccharomycopsis crataegensis]